MEHKEKLAREISILVPRLIAGIRRNFFEIEIDVGWVILREIGRLPIIDFFIRS